MSTDHRQVANTRIQELIEALASAPPTDTTRALLAECESLSRAILAFHMEGIRFRMFNVDRLMARAATELPANASRFFSDARRELEAAGFHTRSHQAPG